MNIEQQYLNILQSLLGDTAIRQSNRTGVDTFKIPPRMIQHDMSDGSFPLLTTKRVAFKTMSVELEGFIKGITSKQWYKDRGCNIWNEWCNPQKVPYPAADMESKARDLVLQAMAEEDDLGPAVYGAAWRKYRDPMAFAPDVDCSQGVAEACLTFVGQEIDQLANIVQTLKTNPEDRRMICLAWNPLGLKHTALPACHYSWQVMKRGEYLDLVWTQRSVDSFLGLPFNIASYGLLLLLLAREAGLKPGVLSGSLADLHLYENHVDQAKEQLSHPMRDLPYVELNDKGSIFDWTYEDALLFDYSCHGPIKAPVAV